MPSAILWSILALVWFPILLAGCSNYVVARNDYDRLASDLAIYRSQAEELQAELAKAQTDLAKVEADNKALQNDVAAAKTELASTQAKLKQTLGDLDGTKAERDKAKDDLAAAQSETGALQRRLAKVRLFAEIVNEVFVPTITGEANRMTPAQKAQLLLSWQRKVEGSGDPQLLQKFKALVDANMADAQMRDFFLYVFRSIPAI